MTHSRDVVAGIEMAFFIPTALLSAFICFRHGVHRSSGWVYTLILCIVRIAGAVCQFLSHNNHTSNLIQTTVIIDSIGLSPLLLATLGMLSRFLDFVNAKSSAKFTTRHFRVIQLLITIGLILCIAGGTSSNTQPDGTFKVSSTSKVGVVLYIVAYVVTAFMYIASIFRISVVPPRERRVPLAILVAFPFILVRLVYSACSVFLHSHLFNLVTGNVVMMVLMAVLEEFIVVAVYVALGFFVDELAPESQGLIAGRAWKNKKIKRRERRRPRGYTKGPQPADVEYGMPPPPPPQYHGIAR